MLELLRKITSAHGVSGCEKKVAELIADLMSEYTDEQYTDNLGNLITLRHGSGSGKRIMLCAHMDEIGFMVTYIEDNGQLRIAPVGGIGLSEVSYSKFISEKGVRGIAVPEGKVKPADYAAEKFYIDIGARDKKEAEKKVKIGDVFRLDAGITRLGGSRVCGHPLDDRAGCAVLIAVARELVHVDIDADIYYVFSAQEEVGCRGAKTAAFSVAPDIALAFDVTATGDTPGAVPMACRIGDGAAIKIKDSSVICDASLVDELIETAKSANIKYQLEVLTKGGTDTSSMQMAGAGCRAGAISIPTRYIHTSNEVLDMNDVKDCVALTVEYIKGLKK